MGQHRTEATVCGALFLLQGNGHAVAFFLASVGYRTCRRPIASTPSNHARKNRLHALPESSGLTRHSLGASDDGEAREATLPDGGVAVTEAMLSQGCGPEVSLRMGWGRRYMGQPGCALDTDALESCPLIIRRECCSRAAERQVT